LYSEAEAGAVADKWKRRDRATQDVADVSEWASGSRNKLKLSVVIVLANSLTVRTSRTVQLVRRMCR